MGSTSPCPRARCTRSWGRTGRANRRSPTSSPAARTTSSPRATSSGTARTVLDMEPDERAAKGVFLAFQYPMEIPGVAGVTFLRTALNALRKKRGEAELTTPEFMKLVREKAGQLKYRHGDAEAPREHRLLRRREEALRDPADGDARADALRHGRDRFRPRHRRAAHRRRRRQRAALARTARCSSSRTTSGC